MITQERELTEFRLKWVGKHQAQVVEELASYSLETKLIPDPYFFLVGEKGKLISPETGFQIDSSIEKVSILGKLEYKALLSLQDWVSNHNEGVALWISPPHKDRSNLAKIVISEIFLDKNQKRLFNYAIRLKIDGYGCLELLRKLPIKRQEVFSTEQLRAMIFPLWLTEGADWLSSLRSALGELYQWKMVETGEAIIMKDRAKIEAGHMIQNGFKNKSVDYFGHYTSSCPQTAFELIFGRANPLERSFPCPKCSRPIPSGRGIIVCPHCGAKKEEFHTTCD